MAILKDFCYENMYFNAKLFYKMQGKV